MSNNLNKAFNGWRYFCGALIGLTLLSIVYGFFEKRNFDRNFFQTDLAPLVNYVEKFRNVHGRLPAENEFTTWTKANFNDEQVEYYSSKPDFMTTWGTSGRDFVVGKLEIKQVLYYRSWDKKTFSN